MMKRYILLVAVFAGILIVGGIAIAQAQRQADEAVVLPPPPSKVTTADRVPASGDVRGGANPLRSRTETVAPATQPGTSQPGSTASESIWTNSIPAAPVRNYYPEPGERAPIRRTAYNGDPAGNSVAENIPTGPTMAPPRGPNPVPTDGAGLPTMAPPQPNLAEEVAGDGFPTASDMNRTALPAGEPGYATGQNHGDPSFANETQPEPSRGPAVLGEYPTELAALPAPSAVPSSEPQNHPQDLPPYATGTTTGTQPDPMPAIGSEPGLLTTQPEQPMAPIHNPNPTDTPNGYDPTRPPYEVSNPNVPENPSGLAHPSYGTTGPGPADRTASNNTLRNNGYPNVPAEEHGSNAGYQYPKIEPVGASPMESEGPTGVGQPARNRSWDGEQLPQLRVVKVAPKEIQVGKPAVFRVEITNVGRVSAHGVEVRDQIPQSTRLISTKPESVTDSHGSLVWQLGEMKPGEKATVEMKLMPTAEGNEIGSVAMVRFGTPASVRTVATRPMLEIEVVSEDQILVESDTLLTIRVSNPGSGVATGVVLEERIPEGLQHPAGAELQYEVGDLAPKASKTIQLKMSAVRPGMFKNILIAKAEGLKNVVRESEIQVVAPSLQIAMNGPNARYLNRKASYEVSVSNPGSAAARDVRLVATLPRGLKFVEANNNGHYDPNTRTVRWALAELPVNETGTVRLTALPVEMGDHAVKIQGTADRAVLVKEEQKIKVDGIAALRFEVVDVNDPIEVGSETAYEIRVLNQGTKDASNVSVQVTLPQGFELIAAEGPGSLRSTQQNGRVIFEPIQRLAPKVDTTYRVRVRGRQAGDYRLRVELNSDDLRAPVVKEESTRVFGDR